MVALPSNQVKWALAAPARSGALAFYDRIANVEDAVGDRLALRALDNETGRLPSYARTVYPHGSERRVHFGCEGEIAEPHHGNAPGHIDASRLGLGQHSERKQVRAAENRIDVGVLPEHLRHAVTALFQRGRRLY